MDVADFLMGFVILLAILFMVAMIPLAIIENSNHAIASEKAKIECVERGFVNYVKFERKWLSDEPLGVICGKEVSYIIED